jgi:hypothetical protein
MGTHRSSERQSWEGTHFVNRATEVTEARPESLDTKRGSALTIAGSDSAV